MNTPLHLHLLNVSENNCFVNLANEKSYELRNSAAPLILKNGVKIILFFCWKVSKWNQLYSLTIAHLWCNGYSTSISTCEMWRDKSYKARVRFGTRVGVWMRVRVRVRVRNSAIFETGGCECGGTRRLKNY